MDKLKIYITGNLGFIGSHLEKELKKLGHETEGFDIKKGGNFKRNNGFIYHEKQDIRELYRVEQSIGDFKPDVVIHLAALAGVRESLENPRDYFETNITGTYNVLLASKKYKVKNVLVASSSSVYGDHENPLNEEINCYKPLSPYAASKIGTEAICQYFGKWLTVNVFRPFTVFGSGVREVSVFHQLIESAKNKTEFTMYGDGSSSRGYTYVGDLVDGIIKLMNYFPQGCDVLNLGGDEEISLQELIEIVKNELGSFPIKQEDYHFADIKHSLADITKAKKLLAWEPTRKFKDELITLCKKA